MSKIKLLSEAVCNRIAAGEVIERPASVVKELLENSLDAGATRILIKIEKAGQSLIAVTDNGEGMDPDDALLCMETHATSKIASEEDIFHIASFGFRGEAMPSIASISRMNIRTRRRELQEGVEVVVHGAKMIASNPIGCAPGTEILVRELFYNVPARKKFLRTNATEERHIMETVSNISLANAHVTFELFFDGRSVFSSPGADTLIPRIRELFGKELANSLCPIEKNDYNMTVSGYISKRSYTRPSRQDQRIFVNGRPIESQAVYRAIRDGFGPTLEHSRYPAALIFLSMPPTEVDVNVHPTKKEVRFRNEFDVTAAVRSAVTSALRMADPVIPYQPESSPGAERKPFFSNYIPAMNVPDDPSIPAEILLPDEHDSDNRMEEKQSDPGTLPSLDSIDRILQRASIFYQVQSRGGIVKGFSTLPNRGEPGNTTPERPPSQQTLIDAMSPPVEEPSAFRLQTEDAQQTTLGSLGLHILGMFENSYIIATIPSGLVLIDQHAAHERVLYERILKNTDAAVSQKLLLPITLDLSRAEILFVLENVALFEKIGFEIEPFGQNTLKISGIPAALPQDNAGNVFRDTVARTLDSGTGTRTELSVIARAACKAAVKAHDKLSIEEAESLIREMAKCDLPFSCPHGRPTVLNISLSEIERRFGRK